MHGSHIRKRTIRLAKTKHCKPRHQDFFKSVSTFSNSPGKFVVLKNWPHRYCCFIMHEAHNTHVPKKTCKKQKNYIVNPGKVLFFEALAFFSIYPGRFVFLLHFIMHDAKNTHIIRIRLAKSKKVAHRKLRS